MIDSTKNEIAVTKKYLFWAVIFFGSITPLVMLKFTDLLLHPAHNVFEQSFADIWALPIPIIIFLGFRLNSLNKGQNKTQK